MAADVARILHLLGIWEFSGTAHALLGVRTHRVRRRRLAVRIKHFRARMSNTFDFRPRSGWHSIYLFHVIGFGSLQPAEWHTPSLNLYGMQ